jgi:hypothetical protein
MSSGKGEIGFEEKNKPSHLISSATRGIPTPNTNSLYSIKYPQLKERLHDQDTGFCKIVAIKQQNNHRRRTEQRQTKSGTTTEQQENNKRTANSCVLLPVLEYHPLLSEIANETYLELVRVRFWTAENTGLGSWRGPPFVTNYKQHCLAFDVKTGAEVSSEFQTIGFSIPRN